MAAKEAQGRRKVVTIEPRVLSALEAFARDEGVSLDALADRAFRDLLRKHNRPASLREALKQSNRTQPANDRNALRGKPRDAGLTGQSEWQNGFPNTARAAISRRRRSRAAGWP